MFWHRAASRAKQYRSEVMFQDGRIMFCQFCNEAVHGCTMWAMKEWAAWQDAIHLVQLQPKNVRYSQ